MNIIVLIFTDCIKFWQSAPLSNTRLSELQCLGLYLHESLDLLKNDASCQVICGPLISTLLSPTPSNGTLRNHWYFADCTLSIESSEFWQGYLGDPYDGICYVQITTYLPWSDLCLNSSIYVTTSQYHLWLWICTFCITWSSNPTTLRTIVKNQEIIQGLIVPEINNLFGLATLPDSITTSSIT
jgi:hypothetical protein